MRSNKVTHHPSRNADDHSTVEDQIELLRTAGAFNAVSAAAAFATDNRLIRSSGTARGADASAITADDSGNLTGVGTLATSGTITKNGGTTVAGVTQTDFISGLIPVLQNKDYKIVVKLSHALTITETTTISASGTCTFTFKINTTALGGTANSVSSVEQSQAHSTNNAAAAGDDLVITASANSSCIDASFTILFTKTLV